MAKSDKGPSPFKIWLEEKNYTGHRNKRIVYAMFGVGLMIGFALGVITSI